MPSNYTTRTQVTSNYTTRPSLIKIAMPVIFTWFWNDLEVWDDTKYWLDNWWEILWTSYNVRPTI